VPSPAFRHGDLVEVKSAAEILATLDSNGMLEGLPFMPEMVRYCGRRLTVDQRTEKICDTMYPVQSRRMPNTVILGTLRCDGSGHDGCQSDCRIFWKEAWLRRAHPGASPPAQDETAQAALMDLAARNTRHPSGAPDMYQCQETELHNASYQVRVWDPRSYWRVYTAGNVPLGRFLRVMARAVIEEPARKLRLTARPWVKGTSSGSARATPLNLQPGDLVQIKSLEEIIETLDATGSNRGLFFDREMAALCGKTFRVRQRITRFIDDRAGGKMVRLRSDCITLEDAVCSGELSTIRWFCPRKIYGFWREIWLRRVEMQATPEPPIFTADHHPGTGQLAEPDDGATEPLSSA